MKSYLSLQGRSSTLAAKTAAIGGAKAVPAVRSAAVRSAAVLHKAVPQLVHRQSQLSASPFDPLAFNAT